MLYHNKTIQIAIIIICFICPWNNDYVLNLCMKPLYIALRCYVAVLRYIITLRYCVTLLRCVITLRYVSLFHLPTHAPTHAPTAIPRQLFNLDTRQQCHAQI